MREVARARPGRASKDAAAVKSKRAAPGEVGKAAGKRPALGKISVNARRGRDEKKRKSGGSGSDVSLALTIRTPPSGAGSSGGGGKKRGRAAPAFAVAAVDERGVVLGCSKCRYGRYGCATCRERAGVFETAVALILDDAKELERNKENEESERGGRRGVGAAPAAKRARRAPLSAVNDERVSRATAKAKAAEAPSARLRGSDANAKAKARKPSAKASAVDALAVVDASPKPAPAPVTAAEALAQCLLPIDVEDDFNEETLASKLPPGVALGCSKCRHNWRGCGVCRKRAGVWLPPSRAWRKRRGLDDGRRRRRRRLWVFGPPRPRRRRLCRRVSEGKRRGERVGRGTKGTKGTKGESGLLRLRDRVKPSLLPSIESSRVTFVKSTSARRVVVRRTT